MKLSLLIAALALGTNLRAEELKVPRLPRIDAGWTPALSAQLPGLDARGVPALAHTLEISGISLDKYLASPLERRQALAADAALVAGVRGDALAAQAAGSPEDFAYVQEAYGPHLSAKTEAQALALDLSRRLDSAVELELQTSAKLLDALDTADGRLGRAGNTREKVAILKEIGRNNAIDYSRDRRVPGVAVKKTVKLEFREKTRFQGKLYAPGRHTVDVSRALGGPVHFLGREHVTDASGFELHFRGRMSAGQASRDATAFVVGLGKRRPAQHVYLVAPLPVERLRAAPALEAAAIGDHLRRTELGAHLSSIWELGMGIKRNIKGKITYFAPITADRLAGVTRYLEDLGRGLVNAIGDRFKMGFVGFRGADKFDQPGLYGFEYRAVHRSYKDGVVTPVLDSIQDQMRRQDYGLSREIMARWLARYGGENSAAAVERSWYLQPWDVMAERAPSEVKEELKGLLRWGFRRQLKRLCEDHMEIGMLLHDWSRDPLFFEDAAAQAKVAAAQVQALHWLREGYGVNGVMRRFIEDSGLRAAVSASLGVR